MGVFELVQFPERRELEIAAVAIKYRGIDGDRKDRPIGNFRLDLVFCVRGHVHLSRGGVLFVYGSTVGFGISIGAII